MPYTFAQLKTRGWLAIDDSPTTPVKVSDTNMGLYINDAIEELAPVLNILKSATPTFTAGVASLPSDFIKVHKVYDGTDVDDRVELKEVTNLNDIVADTNDPIQYEIRNNTQIRIHGVTPVNGSIEVWYYAAAAALSASGDIPTEIPARFQRMIPEVYCKAQYYLSQGRLNEYAGLMSVWDQIKGQVKMATETERNAQGNRIHDVYGIAEE